MCLVVYLLFGTTSHCFLNRYGNLFLSEKHILENIFVGELIINKRCGGIYDEKAFFCRKCPGFASCEVIFIPTIKTICSLRKTHCPLGRDELFVSLMTDPMIFEYIFLKCIFFYVIIDLYKKEYAEGETM